MSIKFFTIAELPLLLPKYQSFRVALAAAYLQTERRKQIIIKTKLIYKARNENGKEWNRTNQKKGFCKRWLRMSAREELG